MIAELALIVDLLKKSSLRSTPTISQPDYDWRLKKPKPVHQVTGEGERFRPPITIDPSRIDFAKLDWIPRKGF